MGLEFEVVAIDAHDPSNLGRFWAAVLDYEVEYDSRQDPKYSDSEEHEVVLAPKSGSGTRVGLYKVPDEKKVKNRLHFDLRPDDQEAEVARVEKLGAKRVDIGQGEQTWVVLADPEGNEFCILRARSPQDG